jgi:hypothetical protein
MNPRGKLRANQCDVGQLGGAVEAERKAYCTDPSIDVELHVAEVEKAFDILLAHRGKDERADVGKADLATVGVAGQHDIDERKAGVEDDLVDVVRLMAHEENRGVATLERGIAVDEDRSAVSLERLDDVFSSDVDVVIPENAETLWGFEGREDFGTDAGGLPGDGKIAGAAADVIAREEDEVRIEHVGLLDHALEEEGLGVLLQVDVAHLDDAEVLESVGQVANRESDLGDFEFVAGVGAGVSGEADACRGGSGEETPAGDGGSFRGPETTAATRHSPS